VWLLLTIGLAVGLVVVVYVAATIGLAVALTIDVTVAVAVDKFTLVNGILFVTNNTTMTIVCHLNGDTMHHWW